MAEMRHCPRRHVVDVRIAGDVRWDGKGATPPGFDGLDGGRVFLRIAGGDGDVRSRVGQPQRHSETQTPVAAGNQGHAPGEVKQVAVAAGHSRRLHSLPLSAAQF